MFKTAKGKAMKLLDWDEEAIKGGTARDGWKRLKSPGLCGLLCNVPCLWFCCQKKFNCEGAIPFEHEGETYYIVSSGSVDATKDELCSQAFLDALVRYGKT